MAGALSTSIFTSLSWPARSVASFSRAGLTIRHGPHHGAQMSTSTGTVACSATAPNESSPASTIQGSGAEQLPQRGAPWAIVGTRFCLPQFAQRTVFVRLSVLLLVPVVLVVPLVSAGVLIRLPLFVPAPS